jgi:hypothetical protein
MLDVVQPTPTASEPIPAPSSAFAPSPNADPALQPTAEPIVADPVAPAADPAAQPAAEPAPTEPALYELPDGRKVTADVLAEEWKTKFMPDYTKKSQAIADIQRAATNQPQTPSNSNPAPQNPWEKPDWVPQTYQEILEAAKGAVMQSLAQEEASKLQVKQQVNTMVENQLAEIRKVEPNVSEELLFQHANKYGFGDLTAAFKNMQDFNIVVKRTEQRVQQNLNSRASEPVAVATQQPSAGDGIDYRSISGSTLSPVEMLQSLKGK